MLQGWYLSMSEIQKWRGTVEALDSIPCLRRQVGIGRWRIKRWLYIFYGAPKIELIPHLTEDHDLLLCEIIFRNRFDVPVSFERFLDELLPYEQEYFLFHLDLFA